MIQEQQQQTNQWVLTPVQFNLVFTVVQLHIFNKTAATMYGAPTLVRVFWSGYQVVRVTDARVFLSG